MHENQLFLGRNAIKKLDFVPFLDKSCIFKVNPLTRKGLANQNLFRQKRKRSQISLTPCLLGASGWA